MKLRDYQEAAIEAVSTKKNTLLVLATAGGKSLIIAGLAKRFADKRILVLAHRASLIYQNNEASQALLGEDTAIYCAELKEKNLEHRIVFASRGSLANVLDMPQFDFIIIDEVHLLNEQKGQYFSILSRQGCFEDNPRCRIVGLTATPWRNNSPIYGKDMLFDKIDYELCTDTLVERGFLSPYVFPEPKAKIDVSNCRLQNGDYAAQDLEEATSSDEIVEQCLEDWNKLAHDRKLSLFFCTGIKHAETVARKLVDDGYLAEEEILLITGGTKDKVALIASIQENLQIKAIVSVEVLTTGTNVPRIDCIVMLRPTQSATLHIQMTGRGLRTSEGKVNCLMIDIAGNMSRFGSINRPYLDQKNPVEFKKSEETGEFKAQAEQKACKVCGTGNAMAARVCYHCGNLFIKKVGVFTAEDSMAIEIDSYELRHSYLCSTGKVCPLVVTYYTLTHGKISEYIFSEWKSKKYADLLPDLKELRGEILSKNKFKMINPQEYTLENGEVWKYGYGKTGTNKFANFYKDRDELWALENKYQDYKRENV